jgi:hypothetical protein
MRLTIRDGLTTLLVAGILLPYAGFLEDGSVPLVRDARGMAGVGLLLGTLAFLSARRRPPVDPRSTVEILLGAAALAVGAAAVLAGETAAGPVVLAVFMLAITAVWAVEMLDHAGVLSLTDDGDRPAIRVTTARRR